MSKRPHRACAWMSGDNGSHVLNGRHAHFHFVFFFNDPATTEIYTLSLHDALPIPTCTASGPPKANTACRSSVPRNSRSEEHTSELQSRGHLVCRLLLEKKKQK